MSASEHCDILLSMSVTNLCFCGTWSIFAAYWFANTWWLNFRYSRPLQKALFFVLAFKAMCDGFTGVLFAECPFTNGLATYWNLAVNTSFTLYSTLVYLTLLLIAKGFCISRNYLEKGEVSKLVTLLIIAYLGFSAYMLEPVMMSLLAILLVGVMFYLTVVYTKGTLIRLERQIDSFRNHDIPQMVVPTTLKLKLMKRFYRVSCLFFALRLVHLVANEVIVRAFTSTPFAWFMWGDIVGGFGEAATLISICMLVRAKDNGRYSSLEWVGSYDVRIAPLIQAKLPKSACKEPLSKMPVLVTLAKGRNAGRFEGLEIGFPEE